MRTSKNTAFILAFLATVLFVLLFAYRRVGPLDFWSWMSVNIALLVSLSFALEKSNLSLLLSDLHTEQLKKILLGVLSGIMLYLIFYAGNSLSGALFPSAPRGVANVYAFRENAPVLRITLLMVFLIGPGEELFWRCFLQRNWQNRFGPSAGRLSATALYSLVHLGSGNAMLVLAALVCGLFWGGLYIRYRSPLVIIISHTLWDILIFVAFPLGNIQLGIGF